MWPLTEPRNHAVSFCVSELGVSLCIRFGHELLLQEPGEPQTLS